MEPIERDRRAYNPALTFIRSLEIPGVDHALIDKYLRPDTQVQAPSNLSGIYFRLLFHAQNANMKSKVIGGSIDGIANLRSVLFDFDPHAVLSHYETPDLILNQVVTVLTPRGEIRRTTRSLWPLYCKSVLSAAKFTTQFSNAADFYSWVRFFDGDSRARAALPMLIEREVFGVGFALACDFIKELGFQNFSKPDVHIKDILEQLQLADSRSDYDAFRAVARIADSVGEAPYCVDRVFWLIGSGNFYNNPEIGNKGRIGNHKAPFFAFALPRLDGTLLQ